MNSTGANSGTGAGWLTGLGVALCWPVIVYLLLAHVLRFGQWQKRFFELRGGDSLGRNAIPHKKASSLRHAIREGVLAKFEEDDADEEALDAPCLAWRC